MDALDREILTILGENARISIKDLARRVALSSPAVSQRIRRMEASGLIEGYTVLLGSRELRGSIRAIISIYVAPKDRDRLREMVLQEGAVEECFQVTGTHSHMVKVCCRDIEALETLISRLQKLGQTSTQIILSAMRGGGVVLPE